MSLNILVRVRVWSTHNNNDHTDIQLLLYLHEKRGRAIVHGNIRPSNVMFNSSMEAMLGDWHKATIDSMWWCPCPCQHRASRAGNVSLHGPRTWCPIMHQLTEPQNSIELSIRLYINLTSGRLNLNLSFKKHN